MSESDSPRLPPDSPHEASPQPSSGGSHRPQDGPGGDLHEEDSSPYQWATYTQDPGYEEPSGAESYPDQEDDDGPWRDYLITGPLSAGGYGDPSQGNGGQSGGNGGQPGGNGGQHGPAPFGRGAATGPVSDPQGGSAAATVKIGLWGSPASGKTTYLAALRLATAAAQREESGTWGIFPSNKLSRDLLVDLTQELTQGRFPNTTIPGTRSTLRWLFVGDLAGSRFARRGHKFWRRDPDESRFELDLIDVSGKAFGYDPAQEGGTLDDQRVALDHLTAADGLIYLFDPLGEREYGNSTNYVNRTIGELRLRHRGVGGPHLPQHVAVCVTKFDHPDVFKEARRLGLVQMGPDGMPRVPDESAEHFFDLLCTGKFWSEKREQGDRSAWFVRKELANAFGADKIEYFVTSSIGFWRQPGWRGAVTDFDPEDFANFRRLDGDKPSIRGSISPINVLEPLIRLQQRISRHR
jgi:hypothetical protein